MSLKTGRLFGGVEGGGTCSKLVVVDDDGNVLLSRTFGGLNYHIVGLENAVDRVATVILEALAETCGVRKLTGLGLGLSGAKDGSTQNEEFVRIFKNKYPDVSENVYLTSDTLGTLKAILPNGGAVVISGTGSSSLLMLNEHVYRCGGNGHLVGDRGSGIWIALRAIRYVLDDASGWEMPPHDCTLVRNLLHSYFEIEDDLEILNHLYKSFSKPKVSGFCKELSKYGSDKLVAAIFNEAGVLLGRHIDIIAKKAIQQGINIDCLEIVAVGSVFESWNLLKKGFIKGVSGDNGSPAISEMRVYAVKGTVAKGLAYMASKEANFPFQYDFEASRTLLCAHKFT
ncbi:unnamed protein product [Enterobius vermicularis]|uniref:N-acetyl-D-glucosamine kinase n=1 Tax=Enterobius vermicularis TaxID=51028 RepID=A0A158QA97_ENTVE|nr:unnamed protein product [Enterobius vermicularis]